MLKNNKKFTTINESFPCAFCGHMNQPAPKTCRNHCQKCLHSLHVDKNPGDRAEDCHGKLIPTSIEVRGGEMQSIIFTCEKCGQVRKNKIAEDDDRDALFLVLQKTKIL